MARTTQGFSAELRATDFLGLGSLFETVPMDVVREALAQSGIETKRVRKLPLEFMVYYIICMALFSHASMRHVLQYILEGADWLKCLFPGDYISSSGALSSARNRLGRKPMQYIFRKVCRPLAEAGDSYALFHGMRTYAIDGTVYNLPDESDNSEHFGRQSVAEGRTAFPQARVTAVCETGTHAVIDAEIGPYATGEKTQALALLERFSGDAIYLMDRNFGYYPMLSELLERKVHFLVRMNRSFKLEKVRVLADGSYIGRMLPHKGRNRRERSILLRVIEYTLSGSDEQYRVVTDLFDDKYPADELAALYHERWEVESVFDEMKDHLKASQVPIRSKTTELVYQELYGHLITHYIIRRTMYRSARSLGLDPDCGSFVGTIHVIRRKVTSAAFPPDDQRSGEDPARDTPGGCPVQGGLFQRPVQSAPGQGQDQEEVVS